MKIRKSTNHDEDKVELQMTPMIDIVFQLLTFFIMTFQIVDLEGDFNLSMVSLGREQLNETPLSLPQRITLKADSNGELASISVNGKPVSDFNALHQLIFQAVNDAGGPGAPGAKSLEAEVECDYHLKYSNTMKAITAISGEKKGEKVIKLIENLRFIQPK